MVRLLTFIETELSAVLPHCVMTCQQHNKRQQHERPRASR